MSRHSIYKLSSPSIGQRNRAYRMSLLAMERADFYGTFVVTMLRSLNEEARITIPEADIRHAQVGDTLDAHVTESGDMVIRVINPDLDAQVRTFQEEQRVKSLVTAAA